MPGTSTEPVVDKGIRQKSIHSFHSIHSFPDGSAFCPGAPKRVPSDSEKHRRVYTSSNVCHSHEWRVDMASGLTLKKQNACLHAVRHAVEKNLRVYTASEAKGLMLFCYLPIHGSHSWKSNTHQKMSKNMYKTSLKMSCILILKQKYLPTTYIYFNPTNICLVLFLYIY